MNCRGSIIGIVTLGAILATIVLLAPVSLKTEDLSLRSPRTRNLQSRGKQESLRLEHSVAGLLQQARITAASLEQRDGSSHERTAAAATAAAAAAATSNRSVASPPRSAAHLCSLPEFEHPLRMTIYVSLTPIPHIHHPPFPPFCHMRRDFVQVFAWRRLASLERLMNSLLAAEFCGHRIPLHIVVDRGALASVLAFVRRVDWTHGPLTKRIYDDESVDVNALGVPAAPPGGGSGIRGMWIYGTGGGGADEHILPLEDDIQLSPLFYWWLVRAVSVYGDGHLAREQASP